MFFLPSEEDAVGQVTLQLGRLLYNAVCSFYDVVIALA